MSVWRFDKTRLMHQRIAMLGVVFVCLILILMGRVFYLQILQGDKYMQLAEKNRISIRLTPPARGNIYDRNGLKLAENIKTFQAVLIKEHAQDINQVLENFQKLIPLDSDEVERIRKEIKFKRAFMPVRIKDNLSFEEISLIQLNAPDLMGIQIEEGMTRYYRFKEDSTHVVGYVSLLTEKDMEDDPENPLLDLPGYRIGRTGIEQSMDDILKGTPGIRKTEVNAYGRSVRVLEEKKPINGQDITLTIDSRLQSFATELLKNEGASAILANVQTGEILMLVSAPAFDPNLFTAPISVKNWNQILNNEKKPLQNKAISGTYSPGSIFKPIVALAGLESKKLYENQEVFCGGRLKSGNQFFHCWKRAGHGHLNMTEALMHSCDIFFYEIAPEIGADKIIQMAQKLGFGSLTGIELRGERTGILPSEQWKQKTFKEGWRTGDTINLSIGQGYLTVTPIQILKVITQIANGGKEISLHLIKDASKDRPISDLGLNPYHLRLIKRGLSMVVNQKKGTAYNSRFEIDGKTMAGKTASTQVRRISLKEREEGVKSQEELPWKYRDHAMFAGFTPVNNPKYAVAVVVEHGGGGAKKAAPIASKILQEALRLDKLDAHQNRLERR